MQLHVARVLGPQVERVVVYVSGPYDGVKRVPGTARGTLDDQTSFRAKDRSAPEATSRLEDTSSDIELHSSADGAVTVPVRLEGDTIWATQAHMAQLYGMTQQNVSLHLQSAYRDGELDGATHKDFFQVRSEGTREVARSVQRELPTQAVPSLCSGVQTPLSA